MSVITDWTADNFAVDDDGRVTLVDGENFVLVDQKVSGISIGIDKIDV